MVQMLGDGAEVHDIMEPEPHKNLLALQYCFKPLVPYILLSISVASL
jgi:hypothetical protein